VVGGEVMKELTKGDIIFWRWKESGTTYCKEAIEEVNGDFITFDYHGKYTRVWIDINEIEYKRVQA